MPALTYKGVPCLRSHSGLRYEKNKACVECARSAAAAKRLLDPERDRAVNALWRAKNADKLKRDKAAYAKNNRDAVRSANRNAKARRRQAIGRHTASDIADIRTLQNDACFYCPTLLNGAGHADHFMPLKLRGTNGPENIVLGCPPCNMSKGSKHPLQWMVEQEISGIIVEVREGILIPVHAVRSAHL